MATTVDVQLGSRSYPIEIETGLIRRLGQRIAMLNDVSQVVLITDTNVERLYANTVSNSLLEQGIGHHLFVIPAGETSKSIDVAFNIWNKFSAFRVDRKSLVVALGGGVVGDLAGFVAATFARGIRFYQVPTTLLAQVDSSVGGKTAINLPGGKNMVGAFHQPVGVTIDPETLATLDNLQYRAGLGEVLKYGVSLDRDFLTFLETHVLDIKRRSTSALEHVISRCCRIKADIVEKDECETLGLRTLLNYGHTFAHAMEAAAGYGAVLHGIAVALGSIYSVKLSCLLAKRGVAEFQGIDDDFVEHQIELFRSLNMPVSMRDIPELHAASAEDLILLMEKDKKTERKQRCFVLPTGAGQCIQFRNIDLDLVAQVLDD